MNALLSPLASRERNFESMALGSTPFKMETGETITSYDGKMNYQSTPMNKP
jgi:hypothetical protein